MRCIECGFQGDISDFEAFEHYDDDDGNNVSFNGHLECPTCGSDDFQDLEDIDGDFDD